MLTKTHLSTTSSAVLVPVLTFAVVDPFKYHVIKPSPEQIPIWILSYLLLLLGSIFPDIDQPSTKLGKIFRPVMFFIPHRTLTHSIYPITILGVLCYTHPSLYLWAFSLGYFLHVYEDSWSKQGIAWLRPFTGYIKYNNGARIKRRKILGKRHIYYRVGSKSEHAFHHAMLGLSIVSILLLTLTYLPW